MLRVVKLRDDINAKNYNCGANNHLSKDHRKDDPIEKKIQSFAKYAEWWGENFVVLLLPCFVKDKNKRKTK